MKELWTRDEASFHGDLLELEPSWAWPKPLQKPHPPIIMGGSAGPKTIAHIVEFCDGWMPIYGRYPVAEKIEEVKSAAAAAGRDPETIDIGVFGAPRDRAELAQLAAAGVSMAVFGLPAVAPDVVLGKLDEYAALIEGL
jgi:alkanesulfonate monooxygenase SsuD/methylene tetrahydromethanopterin reductase-like flavin-dependent oxidoreductase (luciferase family)